MVDTLRPPKAPALPVGPVDYAQEYQNQLNSIQRLYYNQIDNTVTALLDNNGGRFLNFPHIAASDTTDQYAGGDDTPTLVKWNTEESDGGFDLQLTYAEALYSGVYKIDYSLQFVNTDNAQHNVLVWLKVNGANVPRSTTQFTVVSRKSSTVYGYTCAVSFVVFSVNAGDRFQLYWATEKAYNPTGPVDGVYMEYLPAQTSPYELPAIPSAIGSITFVSELPQ
jgi:hypothetical protein